MGWEVDNMKGVVLAAGRGKRMKSSLEKVFHKILGLTMVERLFRTLKMSNVDRIIGVFSPLGASRISSLKYQPDEVVIQDIPRGTGDALKKALEYIDNDWIIVFPGDMPLITHEEINSIIDIGQNYDALLVAMRLDDPGYYGRVILNEDGNLESIIEYSDLTDEYEHVNLVNTGVYVFRNGIVDKYLQKLTNDNNQGEYYLTDIFSLMLADGLKIGVFETDKPDLYMGINNRHALYLAEEFLRKQYLKNLMLNGVTIHMPDTVYIEDEVIIENDVEIWPYAIIKGCTVIKSGSIIGPMTYLEDAIVERESRVQYSHVVGAYIGPRSEVGPFGRLRPGAHLEEQVKIGNFVEVKKSHLGKGSKASHLSYIGDAQVGSNVNIGAGTITCNYDGFSKNPTYIEDNVFIGSDTILVAPVKIGKGAYTAAGSVITQDVPPGALGIGRARQVNKEGWVEKYVKRKKGGTSNGSSK